MKIDRIHQGWPTCLFLSSTFRLTMRLIAQLLSPITMLTCKTYKLYFLFYNYYLQKIAIDLLVTPGLHQRRTKNIKSCYLN